MPKIARVRGMPTHTHSTKGVVVMIASTAGKPKEPGNLGG
jgi:hypothetical protein